MKRSQFIQSYNKSYTNGTGSEHIENCLDIPSVFLFVYLFWRLRFEIATVLRGHCGRQVVFTFCPRSSCSVAIDTIGRSSAYKKMVKLDCCDNSITFSFVS